MQLILCIIDVVFVNVVFDNGNLNSNLLFQSRSTFMRFIAEGPNIPDDLLIARDLGKVVFFCGAGVSRANAGLPDFNGLASMVFEELGVAENSSHHQYLKQAKELSNHADNPILLPIDRLFESLENDFTAMNVGAAVAKSLEPGPSPNLDAHKLLLRLAATPDGLTRLVTTNFDRLFDSVDAKIPTHQPPSFPNPSRPSEFHGIIYLHGRVNSTYRNAEGDGLILSSSKFGTAYLSEGWATKFVNEILRQYKVVFVGYSADDPPIHYLLEALNKSNQNLEGIYAFDAGSSDQANKRWGTKGVSPIHYNAENDHAALWKTFELWAERADEPKKWKSNLAIRASVGPDNMQPFERGQIAHLVSTIDGARIFTASKPSPPASWLYVFDPAIRYSKPGNRQNGLFNEGKFIDPFKFYGLDSDPVPKSIEPKDYYSNRLAPGNAWSAFSISVSDQIDYRLEQSCAFHGADSTSTSPLPRRHSVLAEWLSHVLEQGEAVWWAALQSAVHPEVQNRLNWYVENLDKEKESELKLIWTYILSFWKRNYYLPAKNSYELVEYINLHGWSEDTVYQFSQSSTPFMSVRENYWFGPAAKYDNQNFSLRNLIQREVRYPKLVLDLDLDLEIPTEWLVKVVSQLRRNIEQAIELEHEIDSNNPECVCPIVPDTNPRVNPFSRNRDLSSWVISYSKLFEQLVVKDPTLAKTETNFWPKNTNHIFDRLSIWSSKFRELKSCDDVISSLNSLSETAFWDVHHARDLLIMLQGRWSDLNSAQKQQLEKRILHGPPRWQSENETNFQKRKNHRILDWLNWMQQKKLKFSPEIGIKLAHIAQATTNWDPKYARQAASSLEGWMGSGAANTDHTLLLQTPIHTVLDNAIKISESHKHNLEGADPFGGLCKHYSIRAFSAIWHAYKNGAFSVWAFSRFLDQQCRSNDNPNLICFVAASIFSMDDKDFIPIEYPFSRWMENISLVLSIQDVDMFYNLLEKFVSINFDPSRLPTSQKIVRNNSRDWTFDAINSPAGHVSGALLKYYDAQKLDQDPELLKQWLSVSERLLQSPGDAGLFALVYFVSRIDWFLFHNKDWATNNLLCAISCKDTNYRQAFLCGLFRGRSISHDTFDLLKNELINSIKLHLGADYTHNIIDLCLLIWRQKNTDVACFSDTELREMLSSCEETGRLHVLRQFDRMLRENRSEHLAEFKNILNVAWPKQTLANSKITSFKMFEILVESEEVFAELYDVIDPLIPHNQIPRENRQHLSTPAEKIAINHPEQLLNVLYKILPRDIGDWPYEIENTFDAIVDSEPSCAQNSKYIEIRRRWDQR